MLPSQLRRKDRRLRAQQEADLAAAQAQAAAAAAAEAARRAANPPVVPVVIVQPDGVLELAEECKPWRGAGKGGSIDGGCSKSLPPIGFQLSQR